jgi:hypothetical protein
LECFFPLLFGGVQKKRVSYMVEGKNKEKEFLQQPRKKKVKREEKREEAQKVIFFFVVDT